jgi:spermidine synthase
MKTLRSKWIWALTALGLAAPAASAAVAFELTTAYHHILVTEANGLRTLCFDDGLETQMRISDPLQGHFEYTEFFHMPWLWNSHPTNVLMIGLGGASTQRSFEHYHPEVRFETVEIDPKVLQVARNYFTFKEGPKQKVNIEDGRVFLRRTTGRYDIILLDAYIQSRYGSSIPQHLATKEFFELVRDHLTTNGVVGYNVIGTLNGWRADIVGAIYATLRTVFPQVYIFPAKTSQNVVLIATRIAKRDDFAALRRRAIGLVDQKQMSLPTFRQRLDSFWDLTPPTAARSPILTDDYAPVEGLAASGGK